MATPAMQMAVVLLAWMLDARILCWYLIAIGTLFLLCRPPLHRRIGRRCAMRKVSGSALSHVCILCLCRAYARVSSVWPCRCSEQEGFMGGMPLSALGRRQKAGGKAVESLLTAPMAAYCCAGHVLRALVPCQSALLPPLHSPC